VSDAKEWPPRIRFAEGPAAMRLLFTMVRDGLATVDEAMSCIKVDDDPPPAPATEAKP
jgi:hypothetical protein